MRPWSLSIEGQSYYILSARRSRGTLKEKVVSVRVLARKRWRVQTGIILGAFNKGMWREEEISLCSRFFQLV